MSVLGTVVNAGTIILGSILGVIFKKGISQKVQDVILEVVGLSVVIIGGSGLINNLISVNSETGKLSSSGELLMLVSLVLGVLVGMALDIDGHLNRWGKKLETRIGTEGFAKGFISASVIFCVGAMAIIGSFNDGLFGDHSILFVKSALDGVTSMILASTLGIGVAGSAVAVFIYQGTLTLVAGLLLGTGATAEGPLLTNICVVGNAIIVCIGLSFFGRIKIKTADLLPALLIPIIYYYLQMLI